MTEKIAPSAATVRGKVSTGYARLDQALGGGFLAGSMVVLSAPSSDEVPILLSNFLQAAPDDGLLICRTLSSSETITHDSAEHIKSLVCSDKPVPPSRNVIPGKGIDNLTDINLQINEALTSVQPKRIVLDILSDVLLRHKGLQTRKWLTELLERLRSRNITTLAVLNPYMHSNEDVQAVVDLFDGDLEIAEKDVEGALKKVLLVKWMHGVDTAEKEFPIADLAEPYAPGEPVIASVPPLAEPRWLTPLISRSSEMSRLRRAFDSALAGNGSVVALEGEPGVGKTRLMHELGSYARSKNALVLSGSASEDGLAYAPWIEITRQYVGQTPGELLRRILGPGASELVKLVPDLAAKIGTIPPLKSLGEQQDKLRFYDAVTQLFITICKESPLVLLFDDMQHADQSSLDLLEYLVRSSSNLRVLTVCSLPPEQEIETNSPLEQTLMKFNKQRLLERIPVRGLDLDGTTRLVRDVFGEASVSQEFTELIFERTGGNPFFVEEVLHALVEDGTIYRTGRGWDRKPIQELTIPRSVKTALRSRLTKLDPEALSILQWAAVAGSEFDFELLLNVSQSSEDALVQKVETFISQGLLAEVPHEKSKLRFADNRIRELLLDDLIQIKRTRYHLKIGEAMEKVWAGNLESRADLLATHFSDAGDIERSIKYSIIAGERNRTIHAYERAILNFKKALDLMAMEKISDQQKATVLERLGDVDRYAGRMRDSIEAYQRALGIFENLHDSQACARLSASLAETIYLGRGLAAASEVPGILIRGLKFIENESESPEAASIYAILADFYSLQDRYDDVNTWIDKAVAAGEKTGNFRATVMALSNRAYLHADLNGNLDEALSLLKQALDLALKHGEDAAASYVLFNLITYTSMRSLEEGRAYAARLVEHARQIGDPMFEARGLAQLWFVDWLRGEWETATKELQDALAIKERVELITTPLIEGWRSWFWLNKGDLDAAEKYANLALASNDPKITHIVITNLSAALLQLELGRESEAVTHLQLCVEAFKKSEFTTVPLLHIETLMHLGVLHATYERFEEAASAIEWARRLAETLKSNAGLAMASQAQAYLLLRRGAWKASEEAYLNCLGLWDKAGWPYYKAKALVAYSEAVSQTNPEESKKLLQEAAGIFRKLGARRDLEKAEAKLSPQ